MPIRSESGERFCWGDGARTEGDEPRQDPFFRHSMKLFEGQLYTWRGRKE
jgi:hypothetical protein